MNTTLALWACGVLVLLCAAWLVGHVAFAVTGTPEKMTEDGLPASVTEEDV